VITVIGGLVSFLTNYKNVFEVLAERNQTTATSTQNVASTTTPNSVDPEEAPPEPLQVPEKFQSLVGSQPKTGSNNKATIEGSTAKDSTDKGSTARTSEDGMTGSGSKKKDANALSENTDGEKMEPKDPPQANKSELSPAEKAASASVARVAVDMVRAALMRRDIPAARTANQRIKRLSGAEFLDAQTMSLLEYQRTQNEQMIAHVEVFLTQLQSAAVEMPGGQDVEVGKLVMSLVDGGPTEVTLRRAGRNDVVPYTDLPTSVAIALGDLGSKKSVPKWNMAKAAVLTIQSQHTPALNEKAKPFLRQSIADGYDVECQTISDYQNIAWQKKHLPAKLSADPTAEQADDLLREFRAANGYKNPKRVKSDGAPNVIEELLFSPAPTPKERKARLSDAITVAAAQKDFDAVLVATGELYRMSKPVNIKDTVVSPISHLMRDDMSAAETRHLVHTIIGLTKQLKGRKRFEEQAKDKLLGHAQTLVEEFDYSELAPKIKQLMKQ